ncbi:basic proline-rich protein-like [Mustela putorius furo]|uniref:Basic proline-rich protein-like n=1 Tax=Mustela putorius furo TaxID=9669 RepID=A0A8U0V2E3_MUSPF|nr:basic proline-rich protein-like [Mustela putorius furo]
MRGLTRCAESLATPHARPPRGSPKPHKGAPFARRSRPGCNSGGRDRLPPRAGRCGPCPGASPHPPPGHYTAAPASRPAAVQLRAPLAPRPRPPARPRPRPPRGGVKFASGRPAPLPARSSCASALGRAGRGPPAGARGVRAAGHPAPKGRPPGRRARAAAVPALAAGRRPVPRPRSSRAARSPLARSRTQTAFSCRRIALGPPRLLRKQGEPENNSPAARPQLSPRRAEPPRDAGPCPQPVRSPSRRHPCFPPGPGCSAPSRRSPGAHEAPLPLCSLPSASAAPCPCAGLRPPPHPHPPRRARFGGPASYQK